MPLCKPVIATVALGDASIYAPGTMPRTKLAAISGLPNDDILEQNRLRIGNGLQAYSMLQELRDDKKDASLLAVFAAAKADLGYALLLKRWQDSVVDAKPAQIEQAALTSVSPAAPLFWGYKVMVVSGVLCLLAFLLASAATIAGWRSSWLLKSSLYAWPLPWLASGSGRFISEFGRQPWIVADILPTWVGVSTRSETDLIVSMAAYGVAYTGLSALALVLIVKFVRRGCAGSLLLAEESGDA